MNVVGLRRLVWVAMIVSCIPLHGMAQYSPLTPPNSGQAIASSQYPPVSPQLTPPSSGLSNNNTQLPPPYPPPAGSVEQLPPPPTQSVAPGGQAVPPKIVMAIKITGNKSTSDTKVRTYIRTRTGREFDPELVQADVRRLTQSGHFRDVRTFTQPQDGGVALTFEVFERPTIGYINFIGNKYVRDSALLKQSDLKVGDALNQYSIEEGRRKVEEFYHTKGYPKTTVEIFEGNKATDRGVAFLINEGRLQRINKVEFEGNEIATDGRLKTQIQSKPGYFYYLFGGKVDRKKIEEDIEKITAYYRSLGYFRARVSRELMFDENDEWLTLKFIIDEGPRYVVRNISIIGNEKFTTESLMSKLELKPMEYFNQGKMNRDISTLRDEYGSQGHIFADVQADPRFDEEPGVLDLVYKVKEGQVFRVGQISVKIEGDYPHTRNSTVMNRLSLRPGDIINIKKVRESESRLKSSQLFETDQTKGNPPQVVVKPPDSLGDEEILAEKPKRRSSPGPNPTPNSRGMYRGQSPEEESVSGAVPPTKDTPPPARSWYMPWSR